MLRHQIVTIDASETVLAIELEQDEDRLERRAQNAVVRAAVKVTEDATALYESHVAGNY